MGRAIWTLWVAGVLAGHAATAPGLALAQTCPSESRGCQIDAASWLHREAAFDDIMIDSGWQPPGAPIQLRFQFFLGGSTEVSMDADVVTHWPLGIEVEVPGEPETGRLAIDYGVELRVSLRFDLMVGGVRYRWEGDIPVPSIPEDLRMAAEGQFDPFLLPPSDRPFEVTDTTDRVAVVMYDALGGFIPVPGVGGGLAVTVQGELDARYQTELVAVDTAEPILMEGLSTLLRAAGGDFGPSVDVVVHPEGNLDWEGTLHVTPELYLSFAGTRRDYPLVEIPVTFVDRDVNVIFDDVTQSVDLPDIAVSPDPVELGPVAAGARDERILMVENLGAAPLEVTFLAPGAPFAVGSAMVVVPPRATSSLRVWFEPELAGDVSDVLLLETNDPDEPTVMVTLNGAATAATTADAGTPAADGGGGGGPTDDGGCGCRLVRRDGPRAWPSAGHAHLSVLLLLGIALVRRRLR